MKIKYEAQRGCRIKNRFMCLELDWDCLLVAGNGMHYRYFPDSDEWRNIIVGEGESIFKPGEECWQSWCCCHSLKAALRKIKKWNLPKGTKFRLCSHWVGHDIYITV